MSIKIAVLKETRPGEERVALVPSVVDRMLKLGTTITLQSGAGDAVKLPDAAYAGVSIVAGTTELVSDADVVLAVRAPPPETITEMREGATLISFVYADQEAALLDVLRSRNVTCFAMERVPRLSRAQAMDALSSQATLAGYYAALLGATHLARILPRMTTAVGTLRPATVLVMGLGVAGLQALATARRLGAVVEGYDVRPETKEQAVSVGAKFVETGIDARGEGGYARELTEAEKQAVADVLTSHIQGADVIITTASVPGRRAPRLISKAQVEGMKAGAVIIDLAAESGGNCELTCPGETIRAGQVTIVGPVNVPSLLGEHASELYSKNLLNFLTLLVRDGQLAPDWSDEVIAKTALTGGSSPPPPAPQPDLTTTKGE
jgi:NAD(P) transhydrogenase subunit alpha